MAKDVDLKIVEKAKSECLLTLMFVLNHTLNKTCYLIGD